MTHWRGPLDEDLGQPHVNLGQCSQERGNSWNSSVQDQELDSVFLLGPFQLRIFHDLVILWIPKALLIVLAGLQLVHGWGHQDRGVWIWTPIPAVSYSHVPLSNHSPEILVGDRQAEQEVVFARCLPQGYSSCPFLRIWFFPKHFWAEFRWDDLAVLCVWLLPFLCVFLAVFKFIWIKTPLAKDQRSQSFSGVIFPQDSKLTRHKSEGK